MNSTPGDGSGGPPSAPPPGSGPTPTHSWPTVGTDTAPAAGGAPRRPRRVRIAAVAGAAALVVALGGAAVALGDRHAPGPVAAPTATSTPSTSPKRTVVPVGQVSRSALARLDGALHDLITEVEAADELWATTDGQVPDPAVRDDLRTGLDTVSSWLGGAWEPVDTDDARSLADQAARHLQYVRELAAAVQQSQQQWAAAQAGGPTPGSGTTPGTGTPQGGTAPDAPAGDPGAPPGPVAPPAGGGGPVAPPPTTSNPPSTPTPGPGTTPTTPSTPSPTPDTSPPPGSGTPAPEEPAPGGDDGDPQP